MAWQRIQPRAKDEDLWFSRQVGSADGKGIYEKLIHFGKSAKVKSIPEEIRETWE